MSLSFALPARRIATGAALSLLMLLLLIVTAGCSFGSQPKEETLQLDTAASNIIDPTPSPNPRAAPTPRVIAVATPQVWPTPRATVPTRGTGTPEATGTATPAVTPTVAPLAELPRLAASLDEKIIALAQATAARDSDLALKLQQELLVEANMVETLLTADRSAQADLVRQAIREIRAGAAGDANKLDSARSKLRIASGQPADSSSQASGQGPQTLASKLQPKLRAFNEAREEGRVDDLLKLQRELLDEISQTEKTLGNQQSEGAGQLRAALQDIKSGLAGDAARLESGIAALLTIGGASASTTPGAVAGASAQQIRSNASSLDVKISALQEAIANGNRDDLLGAQRQLMEEVARIEGSLQGNDTDEARRLRDALAMARDGASGDMAKLEGASSRLADLTGSEPTPSGQESRPNQQAQRADPAAIADNLSRKIDSYKDAIDKGDRGAMLRLQQELTDQVNRDEEAVKGISGQEAEQLRSALGDLRNALKGDLNKLNSANATLRLVGGNEGQGNRQQPLPSPETRLQTSPEAQQVARDLSNALNSVDMALDSRDPDDLARAQKELRDAEDALSKLPPGDAAALRSAITTVREALNGDRAKLDAAREQLQKMTPR